MKLEETFQELIEKIQDKTKLIQCFVGSVTKLDTEEGTATIEREDKPTLYQVRLNAIAGGLTDKFEVLPAEGSKVLCSLVDNNKTEATIIKYSEIESIAATIGGNSFILDKDGFSFNEGKNGGLVIISELVKGLNTNNQILTTFLTALKTPVVEAGLGAPSAFQAALLAALGSMSPGDFTKIENQKVKH